MSKSFKSIVHENNDTEVDPEYAARHHDHFDTNGGTNNIEDFRFKAIDIPPDNEMKELLKKLVPEQKRGLDKVVKYCTDLVKSSSKGNNVVEPLRLIIHGGAGKDVFRYEKPRNTHILFGNQQF